jgi:hypothetical protein
MNFSDLTMLPLGAWDFLTLQLAPSLPLMGKPDMT